MTIPARAKLALVSFAAIAVFASASVALADGGHGRYHDWYGDNHHHEYNWNHGYNSQPPVFSGVPSDITATTTSSSGLVVTYTPPTAVDKDDNPLSVSCYPPSGSLFHVGHTYVVCRAGDRWSRHASVHFLVTIIADHMPSIVVTMTDATSNPITDDPIVYASTNGTDAPVYFTISAWDWDADTDLSSDATCVLDESGSITSSTSVAIGEHTVDCSVTDPDYSTTAQDSADFVVDDETCSSVANGSAGSYPACSFTCNSGYHNSGSSCVANSNGSIGGGGGSGGSSGSGSNGTIGNTGIYCDPITCITSLIKANTSTNTNTNTTANTGTPGTSGSGVSSSFAFTSFLSSGNGGKSGASAGAGTMSYQVQMLQKFLNGHGFTVAKSGNGSAGKETTYFGAATKKALAAFQKSNGIPATGYFGPLTKKFINTLISQGK